MRPVMQSKLWSPFGIHNGNCYAACIASLLELPLWMVPPFEDMFGRGDWRERTDEWLGHFFGLRLVKKMGHPIEYLPEFYIACGQSARGVGHAVICRDGQLVHDPHFSGTGIESVEYVRFLEPINEAERKLVDLRLFEE